MNFINELNFNNPIIFGTLGGAIVYLVMFFDKKMRKDTNAKGVIEVPLKLPILFGVLLWAGTSYFMDNLPQLQGVAVIGNTLAKISSNSEEMFTDFLGV